MAKKTLYLAFPICDDFQRHELDRKTDDELFDTMFNTIRHSQAIVDYILCYDDIKALFNDLNGEEIESISYWFYKIDVDEEKYNKWFNN